MFHTVSQKRLSTAAMQLAPPGHGRKVDDQSVMIDELTHVKGGSGEE